MASGVLDEYIAGATGGAAGLIVGHPFDTTKVQLQTSQGSTPYSSTFDAIRKINHQGLVRGFFRGLGFPLVSYGVVNSIFFGVYGNTLRHLAGDGKPTISQVVLAGAAGGCVQLTVACPVDAVKVVLQSQIPHTSGTVRNQQVTYFRGPRECLRELYRLNGIRGCYKGFVIQGYRDVPASAIYFLVYETLYEWGRTRKWSDQRGILASLLAGGAAGVLSWYAILPLDVLKSQLQADLTGTRYRGIIHCAQMTYQTGGIQAFFTGAAVNSIRAFLVNAVIFAVHNQAMGVLRRFHHPTQLY